jgi:hypothetical protein
MRLPLLLLLQWLLQLCLLVRSWVHTISTVWQICCLDQLLLLLLLPLSRRGRCRLVRTSKTLRLLLLRNSRLLHGQLMYHLQLLHGNADKLCLHPNITTHRPLHCPAATARGSSFLSSAQHCLLHEPKPPLLCLALLPPLREQCLQLLLALLASCLVLLVVLQLPLLAQLAPLRTIQSLQKYMKEGGTRRCKERTPYCAATDTSQEKDPGDLIKGRNQRNKQPADRHEESCTKCTHPSTLL